MLAEASAPPRQRVSNPERTAQTRKQLLEATIDCLYRYGYGATTTHLVAEMAGVSRGAMVHHFPTKVDLMVAAIHHAYEKEKAFMEAEVAKYEPGLPRLRGLIDVHWRTVRQPEDTAIHEVRIGSRSDPALAAAVAPINLEIAAHYGPFVGRHIHEAGLEPTSLLRGLTIIWALALPMMGIHRAAQPDEKMEEQLLATLKDLQERLLAEAIAASAPS